MRCLQGKPVKTAIVENNLLINYLQSVINEQWRMIRKAVILVDAGRLNLAFQ